MSFLDVRPLLTLGYWFNIAAQPFQPILDRVLLGLIAFILVVGIGLYGAARYAIKEKEQRRLLRRLGALSLWAGVVGFFLYWVNWQGIPVLSMRIFWLGWLGGFGFWKYTILREYLVEVPKRRAAQAERAAYEKWLPKPKK